VIHASDLDPATRAKLGLAAKPRGRRKKADQDRADRQFLFQCRALQLPPVFAQWRFENSKHPNSASRKWRADFVFPDYKLLVEVDGGVWIRGAHGHPADIIRNMTKGNDAALLGFTVLHFTPAEVTSGHAVAFTQKVLETRGFKT
jgi:very-short-patch-repair endonuclease